MRELHEKLLENLNEINSAIHHIKPPMPGFMYDDIRNALPEGDQMLNALQSHLTGEIEAIQSALNKIHLIGEVFGQLGTLRENLSEDLLYLIHEDRSRKEERLEQFWIRVDELSLSEGDKSRIKEWVSSMKVDFNEMGSEIDLLLSSNRLHADSIARNAISD